MRFRNMAWEKELGKRVAKLNHLGNVYSRMRPLQFSRLMAWKLWRQIQSIHTPQQVSPVHRSSWHLAPLHHHLPITQHQMSLSHHILSHQVAVSHLSPIRLHTHWRVSLVQAHVLLACHPTNLMFKHKTSSWTPTATSLFLLLCLPHLMLHCIHQ